MEMSKVCIFNVFNFQLSDFLPVMKLYDLLYPDQQLLPLPDITKSSSTYSMAVTSIWISLSKKAQTDNKKLQRPIPRALQAHVEYVNISLIILYLMTYLCLFFYYLNVA